MSLILGMGIWVFLAWILTIISAILCIIYGIYHEVIKKTSDKEEKRQKETIKEKQPQSSNKKVVK